MLRGIEEYRLQNLREAQQRSGLDDDVVSLLRHRSIPEQERHIDAVIGLQALRAA